MNRLRREKLLRRFVFLLLFVVLWLVLSGLVSLVLPETLADMGLTLLPVFCSRTVLSLLLMAYSRLDLSLLVSLNYSRADWLVRPAHLLLEWNALE